MTRYVWVAEYTHTNGAEFVTVGMFTSRKLAKYALECSTTRRLVWKDTKEASIAETNLNPEYYVVNRWLLNGEEYI